MFRYLLLLAVLVDPLLTAMYLRRPCEPSLETIYGYNATLLDGSQVVTFDRYKGKVLLIVNTATYSDLTVPSYYQINALAETFKGEDFEVLAFPCTEFNLEEPGANYPEVMNGIKYVRPGGGFEPKATFFQLGDVNGDKENPIYTYLKSHCPLVDTTYCSDCGHGLSYQPLKVGDVSWNFEKFLIGKDGKPYTRYHPTNTYTSDLEFDIKNLLSETSL